MKQFLGAILLLVWSLTATRAAGDLAHPVALTVGPQRIAYDSLIHEERDHRGAVAEWDLGGRTQVKGFGVGSATERSEPSLMGRRAGDYQLSGLVVEHALKVPHADSANLRLGWISGQERIAEARARRGAGWSVAGDAALLSERLRLRAEYAASSVASGASPYTGSDGDAAYRLGFELHAPATSPIAWYLGGELSEAGAGFGSLGNPSVKGDRAQLRTYGGAGAGDWQVDLGLLQRRDNLDHDPSRPVVASEQLKAATIWTPAQPALARVLGTPSYRLGAEFAGRRQLPAGDGAIGSLTRRQSMKLTLHGEFTRPQLQWGLRANAGVAPGTIGEFDSPAIRALGLELYGRFDDDSGLALKPTLTWRRRLDPASDAADERWRAKLASPSIGLRHDLRGQFDLAFEHRDRWASEDVLSTDLGAKLVWTLQRPSPNRRGLALAFSGALTDGGTASAGDSDYRLMVSLSTDGSLFGW